MPARLKHKHGGHRPGACVPRPFSQPPLRLGPARALGGLLGFRFGKLSLSLKYPGSTTPFVATPCQPTQARKLSLALLCRVGESEHLRSSLHRSVYLSDRVPAGRQRLWGLFRQGWWCGAALRPPVGSRTQGTGRWTVGFRPDGPSAAAAPGASASSGCGAGFRADPRVGWRVLRQHVTGTRSRPFPVFAGSGPAAPKSRRSLCLCSDAQMLVTAGGVAASLPSRWLGASPPAKFPTAKPSRAGAERPFKLGVRLGDGPRQGLGGRPGEGCGSRRHSAPPRRGLARGPSGSGRPRPSGHTGGRAMSRRLLGAGAPVCAHCVSPRV